MLISTECEIFKFDRLNEKYAHGQMNQNIQSIINLQSCKKKQKKNVGIDDDD